MLSLAVVGLAAVSVRVATAASTPTTQLSSPVHAQTGSRTAEVAQAYVSHSQQPVLKGREGVGRTGNYVDLAICIASLLGSLTIILPYIFNRAHRKLRHALILGLATSDLISSSVIIISTSYLITHDHEDAGDSKMIGFSQAPALCDILGFLTASSIFTQHLWNLAIATVTYSILVYPLATFTITIERRIKWLWAIFWLIAAIMHAVLWGVIGFTDIGGYCQLAPTKGSLTTPLIQFVPRSLVVVTTVVLYAHLFFFLRRTNLFSKAHRSGASVSRGTVQGGLGSLRPGSVHPGSGTGTGTGRGATGETVSLSNIPNQQGIFSALNSIRGSNSPGTVPGTDQGSVGRRPSHVTGSSTVTETIPEHLPCYTAKISPSTDAKGISESESSASIDSGSPSDDEEEGRGDETAETLYERRRKRREREASLSFGTLPISNTVTTMSSEGIAPPVLRALNLRAGFVAERIPRPRTGGNSSAPPAAFGQEFPGQPSQPGDAEAQAGRRTEDEGASDSDNDSSEDSILELRATMAPRRDVVDFQMNSPPQEHLSHFTGGVMQVRGIGAQVFKSRISRAVSTGAMQHSAPLPYITMQGQGQQQQQQPPYTGIWPAGSTFNPWAAEGEVRPSTSNGNGSGNGGFSTPPAAALRRGSNPVSGSPRLMNGATSWTAPLSAPSGASSFPAILGGEAATGGGGGGGGGQMAIAPTIAANTIDANRQRRRKASQAAKRRIAVGLDVEEKSGAETGGADASGHLPRSQQGSAGGLGRGGWGQRPWDTPESGEASLTVMEEFEAAMGDFQWGMDVTQLNENSRSSGGMSPTSGVGGGNQGLKASWIGKVAASVRRQSDATGGQQEGHGGRGGVGMTTHNSVQSSASGRCVESLGSKLNRQASILMLLYPTAYVLLFSVSIIRIVVDLADPVRPGGAEHRSQRALHSVARWFIFAQGAFDAIIFQLVERHFRSRMKRRRKVEMGEPVPLTAWQMLKVWTRTLVFGHGPRK
ncbi:unnamed protein product [Tilletia laevis]|nr:hypothetical protein CF328_g3961 [Tilletia controversa]KAE8204951.1 hypothetical protein CF335_g2474 [Tilletia laevis]CAD6900065.1 unnamed protein product [Tilletia caries]CAD6896456.1 unnamed protein product [Tilletia controversa]CAD6932743.1 unnamed protein product [Tilletia laevis]